jgi:hypothetical protein
LCQLLLNRAKAADKKKLNDNLKVEMMRLQEAQKARVAAEAANRRR